VSPELASPAWPKLSSSTNPGSKATAADTVAVRVNPEPIVSEEAMVAKTSLFRGEGLYLIAKLKLLSMVHGVRGENETGNATKDEARAISVPTEDEDPYKPLVCCGEVPRSRTEDARLIEEDKELGVRP